MSLESEIARLADVLEKGLANLAQVIRQSEIASTPAIVASPTLAEPASPPVPAKRPKAASPPAPVAEPAAAPKPASNGKGPSFDEVVAIAQELARQKTPPVAIKLINAHGAKKLADMDPANYPAFYAAAQVELAEKDIPF